MGTSIRIHGHLSYRSSAALEEALGAAGERIQETVAGYGASLLTLESIARTGHMLSVDVDSFAPESQSFEAQSVVQLLADAASGGYVDFDFEDYPADGFRIRARAT